MDGDWLGLHLVTPPSLPRLNPTAVMLTLA